MKKFKQIAALTIVIIWGLLILSTLVLAFIKTPEAQNIFQGLIFTDICLPVFAYALMLVYRILSNKGE